MPTLPSGLPEYVAGDEDLARFLTQSSHFNKTRVRPSAFLPSNSDFTSSVSRHGPRPVETLWEIGLTAAGQRRLYGAAILKADDVRQAELIVNSDEPPKRHAVIRGWPLFPSDPDEQKARHKELALVLASAAGQPLLFSDE